MGKMPPAVPAVRKNQVIDVVLLALGSSHEGLKALRDVLGSDPRFSVLDGVVDLQPVWEVLEAQPDFAREATSAAMCYVKGLEARLGVQIKMPAALEALTPGERILHASKCPARREDVEKALTKAAEISPPSLDLAPVRVSDDPALRKRQIIGMAAAFITVASIIFSIYSVVASMEGKPDFKRIDAAEFAGDIPIGSARVWGGEVRAALVDPTWMRQPEERRRRQMEIALDRLATRQVKTLILEDDSQKTRATAQAYGRGTRKIQIRFFN
jgi:hypothetical protein